MKKGLSLNSVVVASQNQVSCDLAGEAAILKMSSGVYYGLNEVGASIWNYIQQPQSVEGICNFITGEFDVEVEQCQSDTLTLLEGLLDHELIEITHELAE